MKDKLKQLWTIFMAHPFKVIALVFLITLGSLWIVDYSSGLIESREKQKYEKEKKEIIEKANQVEALLNSYKGEANSARQTSEGLTNEIRKGIGKIAEARWAYEGARFRAQNSGKTAYPISVGITDSGDYRSTQDRQLCSRSESLGIPCSRADSN